MIKYNISVSEELRAKARKDWRGEESGDFETYLRGYIAAIKRFGGCTKQPWGGAVDRQNGAFEEYDKPVWR